MNRRPRSPAKCAAVLLGAEDYDALSETIAVLSDPELPAAHVEGRLALAAGDYVDAEHLAEGMRDAGRLPRPR